MEKIDYKPLIAGVDTLEIGYCIREYRLSQLEWDTMAEAKESAQSTLFDKGTGIRFRGYDFMVLRTGATRYKFILNNEDIQIRIFPDARSGINFPELKITFRSQLLWRHDWRDEVRRIHDWVCSWADVIETKVSRVDITVDFIGPLPKLSPELREVVTRARNKREYGTYERYSEGKHQTGYRFGANDTLCRIYDKTNEILRSDKKWVEHLWADKGWVKGETVTRVEFQCRRKIIRGMQIETIEDLFLIVPDLWKMLTVEWLTIKMVKDDSHRTRWPISEFWRTVQDSLSCFGQISGVSRIKQMRPKGEMIERQLKGMIKSYIALGSKSLAGSDIEYGTKFFRYKLEEWLSEPGFDKEVEKRRHKYDSMEY